VLDAAWRALPEPEDVATDGGRLGSVLPLRYPSPHPHSTNPGAAQRAVGGGGAIYTDMHTNRDHVSSI